VKSWRGSSHPTHRRAYDVSATTAAEYRRRQTLDPRGIRREQAAVQILRRIRQRDECCIATIATGDPAGFREEREDLLPFVLASRQGPRGERRQGLRLSTCIHGDENTPRRTPAREPHEAHDALALQLIVHGEAVTLAGRWQGIQKRQRTNLSVRGRHRTGEQDEGEWTRGFDHAVEPVALRPNDDDSATDFLRVYWQARHHGMRPREPQLRTGVVLSRLTNVWGHGHGPEREHGFKS
jgi:hypothetical protein